MEKVSEIDIQLQKLDKNIKDKDALVELYRIIHSFKGAAGTLEFLGFEKFFHNYESLISDIQKNKIPLTTSIVDAFYKYLEFIESAIGKIKKNATIESISEDFAKQVDEIRSSFGGFNQEQADQRRIMDLLSQFGLDDLSSSTIDYNKKDYNFLSIDIVLEDNIKLKLARLLVILKNIQDLGKIIKSDPPLEELLQEKFDKSFNFIYHTNKSKDFVKTTILKSGEIQSIEIGELSVDKVKEIIKKEDKQEELNNAEQNIESSKNINSVKVKLDVIDKQIELFGELLINTKRFENIIDQIGHPDAKELIYQMKHYMVSLQDIVLEMQLVPIANLFRLFPRMTRSLSQQQSKDVDLRIKHKDIKVDRKMMSHIGDIVTHLLRNAIDHGIETTSKRYQINKNQKAILVVETSIENNVLKLIVKDDGKGIDPENIGKYAITHGLFSKEEIEDMSDEQILNIIFSPHFSSAEKITKTSGRGLGLNIVKKKVEGLNGTISFITKIGKGTAFKVMIPLTKAIIRALLVESGDQIYSISLDDIESLNEIPVNQIEKQGNQYFYTGDNNKVIQIIDLGKIFSVYTRSRLEDNLKTIKIVTVKKGNINLGLIVDEFLKETEIIIKKLEGVSNYAQGISGAAILEDGSVSLIIDPFTIVG